MDGQPVTPDRLSPADSLALDALVESGFEPASIADPALRARAERLSSLMSRLEPSSSSLAEGSTLADATLARVLRAGDRASGSLDSADAAAFDQLVDCGWDAGRTPEWARVRASQQSRLLSRLDTAASATSDLVGATLLRVQREIDRGEALRRVSAQADRPGFRMPGVRMRDVAAAAAVALVGISVFWPAARSMQESTRRDVCASNMGNAGMGLAMYASDHDGLLPRAPSSDRAWWDVGGAHTHTAGLFSLATSGYASLRDLSCPGNLSALVRDDSGRMVDWRSHDEVSFSYQSPSLQSAHRWTRPERVVVLADKSPVSVRAMRGERVDPMARSLNHRGAGQNVLFNDGSVRFFGSPVLDGGDNLWLPRSLEGLEHPELTGRELAEDAEDAFVTP